METENTLNKLLVLLLKTPLSSHTATTIGKKLNMTRQGIWKALNKLKKEEYITLKQIGENKKSTTLIGINWSNPATEKALSFLLTKESTIYERWRSNFADIKEEPHFIILFGSILYNPKRANDIDLIAVVDKNKFSVLEQKIAKIQKTQVKKIHLIGLTKAEFRQEIKQTNKAYLEAIEKGVILYGHDIFVNFIRELEI